MKDTRTVIQEYMDHMGNGEFAEAFAMYADDAIYRISGKSKIAGSFEGLDSIAAGLGKIMEDYFLTAPKITTSEIIVDGDRGVALASGTAQGKHGLYDQTFVFVFRIKDGKIAEKDEILDSVPVETALLGRKLV